MRFSMAAQAVSFGNDAPNQVRMVARCIADGEEGGASVVIAQHVENPRCMLGVRAVIERERHAWRQRRYPPEDWAARPGALHAGLHRGACQPPPADLSG